MGFFSVFDVFAPFQPPPPPKRRRPEDDNRRLREDMERWSVDVHRGAERAIREAEIELNEQARPR